MRYIYSFTTLILFSLICFSSQPLAAQTGTIRGKVVDGESGEVLLGSTVRLLIDGQVRGGAYTDLEGNYTVQPNPPAGDYQLIVSYVSYIDDTVDISVLDGEVTFTDHLLFQDLQIREDLEVVITARRDQASTVTLFNTKRNSINSIDGVSLDLIKRTGDANVASAVQRISGVTVTDGRYVYVRGLGDRYSKTTLNGAELPSLDPNRNSVQLDLFPSNLIDNIIIYKNFTPDLPGNFSGGLIDVVTKDFPDRFYLYANTSFGFNDQSSFLSESDNVPSQVTGDTDWFAQDDGTRELPGIIGDLRAQGGIPVISFNDQEAINSLDQASNAFTTPISPSFDGTSFMNHNHQISLGDQFNLFGRPFGYIANISYRNTFNFYEGTLRDIDGTIDPDGARTARWFNTSSANNIADSLINQRDLSDTQFQRNILWGTLVKLSYKPRASHKFSFNFMRNQSGVQSDRFQEGNLPSDDDALFFQTRTLSYIERSLNVYQLEGDHAFMDGKLDMRWIASLTRSKQDEPDLRFFSNDFQFSSATPGQERTRTNYNIQPALYRDPSRFFRELDETNADVKLHFTVPFKQWNDQEAKIRFGGAYTYKERSFEEIRFEFQSQPGAQSFRSLNQQFPNDPLAAIDAFFAPDNLGVVGTSGNNFPSYGNIIVDVTEDRNAYDAEQNIYAAYLMTELPLTEKLKSVVGVRYERTDAETTPRDTTQGVGILDLNDFLPSVNFIYAATGNMNVRAGYSRTLARPTFREFAPFTSFDFAGDFLLNGNDTLNRTFIDNFDLRWEWYPTPSEIVSFSVFYKDFTDPIEKVIEPSAANAELTFRNVPSATAYGIEIEARKSLRFISPALRNFQLGGNASFIESEVDINEDEFRQIQSVDPSRDDTRPLFGQSPFTFNAELAFLDDTLGIKASLSYSVFGDRIAVVGGTDPDVFEQSRGLLNFSIAKDIGSRMSLRFRANNLLNPDYEFIQEYNGVDYIFQTNTIGRTFSLSFTYSIK